MRNLMTAKYYVIGGVCFLPSGERGLWVRTDRCVAFVKCPQCSTPAGVRCKGTRGPTVRTHYARRRLYTATKKQVDLKRRRTILVEAD